VPEVRIQSFYHNKLNQAYCDLLWCVVKRTLVYFFAHFGLKTTDLAHVVVDVFQLLLLLFFAIVCMNIVALIHISSS